MDMQTPESSRKNDVEQTIARDFAEFRAAAKNWSGVYHTFQFGSAALTATSALILKSEFIGAVTARNDYGAALAAAATLAITVLTTGRFKEKWEANRMAAFAVRDLGYELEKSAADPDKILASLQQVGITRNNAIVGLPDSAKPTHGVPRRGDA